VIIGLVELVHTDLVGNILAVSKGHNIMFDNARISMLFNPSIVGNVSDFGMYFSDFKERVTLSYSYWDSSVLTRYATSSITLASEVLDRSTLQNQDVLTYLYTLTSSPTLPGTARTLRVVGLYLQDPFTYCTAVTLNNPIDHGVSTYVTGYYKLIMGVNEESDLFGNIEDWINRTWYTVGAYEYKKGYNFPSNTNINLITSETKASLTSRDTQSVYDTISINTDFINARLIGTKIKDGNPSVAFLNKGTSPDPQKSRTFLHAAGAADFYANLQANIPTTVGKIGITNIDQFIFPSVDCVNITKSGQTGTSEYNVTMYPHALTDNGPFPHRLLTVFRQTVTNNTGQISYYTVSFYTSENRKWAVYYYQNYQGNSGNTSFTTVKGTSLGVWYKGLVRSYPLNGNYPVQDNSVISNNGVLFYAFLSDQSTLRRYDMEKIYTFGYAEETSSLPSGTQILGYQIDETDQKVVVIGLSSGAGKIFKFDIDDTSSYMEYNILSPNFTHLTPDSLLVNASSSRWYWRASRGKMVWLGQNTSAKTLHYWDGVNDIGTLTETTTGAVIDVCVTEDFKKISYAVQNGASCTWFVRSLEDGSRWALLYSVTRTITSGNGGCYVDGNWMYQLNVNNWGYRTNLITFVTESFPTYNSTSYTTFGRPSVLPNRSIIPGALAYNIWNYGSSDSWTYNTYSYLLLDVSPLTFGWDGTQWVHNHAGAKVTHTDEQSLPLYGSLTWEAPGTENHVSGEYFSFGVNPSGYVFDNSMAYTISPWVYAGIPEYREEDHFLQYPDPLHPSNITITLNMASHPDFLSVETSSIYTKVIFTDIGDYEGKPLSTATNLSYIGEYYINGSSGQITFHRSCNLHSVTVKYYWVKRAV
jgi:hypothetical protein